MKTQQLETARAPGPQTATSSAAKNSCSLLPSSEPSPPPSWVLDAHRRFIDVLFDSQRPFPCFFAPEAQRRGEFAYSWLNPEELDDPVRLRNALIEFLEHDRYRTDRSGLIVMCKLAGRSAEDAFWSLLRHLVAHDETPWPDDAWPDPDDSRWGFISTGPSCLSTLIPRDIGGVVLAMPSST